MCAQLRLVRNVATSVAFLVMCAQLRLVRHVATSVVDAPVYNVRKWHLPVSSHPLHLHHEPAAHPVGRSPLLLRVRVAVVSRSLERGVGAAVARRVASGPVPAVRGCRRSSCSYGAAVARRVASGSVPAVHVRLSPYVGRSPYVDRPPVKTWGLKTCRLFNQGGHGHTPRAPPGVSLPSGSRTRNPRILDPSYRPPRKSVPFFRCRVASRSAPALWCLPEAGRASRVRA
jgi:hypothetical protein